MENKMPGWTRGAVYLLICTLGVGGCGKVIGTGSGTQQQAMPPTANAGGPYSGVAGTAISFSGAGSSDPQGQTLTYAWNFGDGATGTGVSPNHAYAAAGSYTVTLTVTDTSGLMGTATAKATVLALPVANAGGPYSGVAGTAISFSGAGSSDPQGQTLTYAWNFGDGATGTGANPSHAYAAPGSYTVTLTVTDTSGLMGTATAKATVGLAGVALTGMVESGTQPIAGAHVYLLAANTTGYGGAGIAASSANASVSLLNASLTGTSDSLGAYVATNASGAFSMTGDYSCTNGQQLYLYAAGASGAVWMAAVGACPGASGPAITATLNEVSTVAAAYGFAGFATDATHVSSSGTAQAQVGIANAFANAANLEMLATGVARTTTPMGSGTAPQAEIDSLANVLAGCSSGGGQCATLFADATADGTTTGTQPMETATAAINIAHHPGANVATLFGLAGSSTAYAPALSLTPNDWSIALSFSTAALTAHTLAMAIDGQGDVWLLGGLGLGNPFMLAELSSAGAVLSGSGYSLNGYPGGMAIDPAGNVWAAMSNGGVYKLSSSGSVLLQIPTTQVAGLASPYGVAIDGNGDAWIGNNNAVGLFELRNDGTVLSPSGGYRTGANMYPYLLTIDGSEDVWAYSSTGVQKYSSAGGMLSPSGGYSGVTAPAAIDAAGDVWSYNSLSSGLVYELSNAGTLLSPSGYSVCNNTAASPHSCQGFFPGASEPLSAAIDGAGDLWTPVAYYGPLTRAYYNGIVELSNQGTILSGNLGYQTSGSESYYPSLLQVDASGNLWGASPIALVEVVGAAVPAVTPLSEAVALGKVGARP
jgi:PKD repeat protein